MKQVIVIGGGIAGSAAALRAAQYHLQTIWIRGDVKTANRSRGEWVVNIDNMIGIHDGIMKKKYSKMLKKAGFAEAAALIEGSHEHIGTKDIIENTLERVRAEFAEQVTIIEEAASGVSREGEQFVFETATGRHRAPYAILATGVMDRQPLIKKTRGEEVADDPRWIYPFSNRETVLYCIRCEGHLTAGTAAAVLGSSEDAAQVALMLWERYRSTCCVLTNGETPAWSAKTKSVLDHYQIGVHTARIVDLQGRRGQLNRIVLEDGAEIEVLFALVAMGLYRVYNDLARALGAALVDPELPDDIRHVQIDARGETTIPNLFAIGDMTRRPDEPVMKQVYTSQEYAVRAVDAIDRRVRRALRAALPG